MKTYRPLFAIVLILMFAALFMTPALAKGPSLEAWKPAFDPSTAKYKLIVSNVSHPVIRGVYTGFAIRDELWKRSNGQIYLDYKPFSMLGGEVEVLNQLQWALSRAWASAQWRPPTWARALA